MSYGIGHTLGSGLALLWLWHRPAAAAQIRPLAWEPPYAVGATLKRQKKNKRKQRNQKKKKKERKRREISSNCSCATGDSMCRQFDSTIYKR